MSKSIRMVLVCATLIVACVAAVALLTLGVAASAHAGSREMEAKAQSAGLVQPAGIDLDVTFISRAPLYKPYCVDYTYDVPNQPGRPFLCPGTENDRRWPDYGEIVTFTAHIVNKGTLSSPTFDYAWHIDGVEVASGTLPALAPTVEVTATYRWPWAHVLSPDGQRALGQHTVRFTVDPHHDIAETYETNNSLEDRTNAISFSIYITPEMVASYNTPVDPKYPYSAEDWLQKQIAAMNDSFANAVYPVTPQGAALRVRINTIGVTPTDPGPDGQHDGGWFFKDDVRHGLSAYYNPATDIDWGLVHELSHQVSLIDLYAIGVVADNLFVTDRLGQPLNMAFNWPNPGLMGGGDISPYTDHHLYSSHSAAGASTFAGYRNGYYGSYLYDIPLQNYLRVLDNQGNAASAVQVTLYQNAGPWDWTDETGLDAIPEISGTTDSSGRFLLPNRSADGGAVTLNGHVLHDNPFGVIDIVGDEAVFLVKLARNEHEEFHWLDITAFNLAYWAGDRISHTFTLSSHLPPPGAPAAPAITDLRVEGDRARLCWSASPSPGVVGYRIYRATLPRFVYTPTGGLVSGLCFDETYPASSYGGKVYAVTAVNGLGQESGFSNFGWAPSVTHPSSVVITGQGERIILDPRNGYALARQDANGRYRQYVGSVHYHLEHSQFIGLDADEHLLFSHPGDYYDDRHSVRVADLTGRPLLEFGQRGAGPGEFETPAGVAAWGEPCSASEPYDPDEHTLLLLHFDGDYGGVQGEMGTASGAEFTTGRYGQGVHLDDTDTLTYTAAGNLNHTWGAVEFWLRPDWDGDDGGNHTLFWWDDETGRLHLRKDEISNLVFDYFYSGGGCGAPTNVAAWRAGEWHHVAFTWAENEIRLFVDGQQVDHSICGGIAQPVAPDFYIGSGVGGDLAVEATIDELRISDIPRVGNSETCNRILVADSGNHRVQAFDSLGNYLSEFGTFGSGPGQFNNPQGLAVDDSGRVIVVDQGNNRLQVLSFDGQTFDYLHSLSAGFNAPSGVAVDAWGHIVVADTGNNRVVVLDPQGNFLAAYSAPNDGYMGPFNAPRGVAVEPDGDLLVADTGSQRVVTVRGALPGQWGIWLPLISRR